MSETRKFRDLAANTMSDESRARATERTKALLALRVCGNTLPPDAPAALHVTPGQLGQLEGDARE